MKTSREYIELYNNISDNKASCPDLVDFVNSESNEMAVAFAEWIHREAIKSIHNRWLLRDHESGNYYSEQFTAEQLYQKFKSETY